MNKFEKISVGICSCFTLTLSSISKGDEFDNPDHQVLLKSNADNELWFGLYKKEMADKSFAAHGVDGIILKPSVAIAAAKEAFTKRLWPEMRKEFGHKGAPPELQLQEIAMAFHAGYDFCYYKITFVFVRFTGPTTIEIPVYLSGKVPALLLEIEE